MYFLRPDLIWPPIGLIGLASSLNSLSISFTHPLSLSLFSLSLPVCLPSSLSLSLFHFLTPSLPISLLHSLSLSLSLQSFTTWWQYELCFKGYVRQFHKVTILLYVSSMMMMVMVCVFVFLGRWHSQTDCYTWSLEWEGAQGLVLKDGKGEAVSQVMHVSPFSVTIIIALVGYCVYILTSHVVHLYVNGDVCDITGEPRKTRVKFR